MLIRRLSRRRHDQDQEFETKGSVPAPERDDRLDIINAGTFEPPAWSQVPPPSPLLDEMPLVISRHFEDSLPARQAPVRFLEPLGHLVLPSSPAGLVKGITVISAPLAPDLVREEEAPTSGPPPRSLVPLRTVLGNPRRPGMDGERIAELPQLTVDREGAAPPAGGAGGSLREPSDPAEEPDMAQAIAEWGHEGEVRVLPTTERGDPAVSDKTGGVRKDHSGPVRGPFVSARTPSKMPLVVIPSSRPDLAPAADQAGMSVVVVDEKLSLAGMEGPAGEGMRSGDMQRSNARSDELRASSLGESAPVIVDPREAAILRSSSRRALVAGLGEPLADLPRTAKPLDMNLVDRSEQLGMARALRQAQVRASDRSKDTDTADRYDLQAGLLPGGVRPVVTAGEQLPLVPVERLPGSFLHDEPRSAEGEVIALEARASWSPERERLFGTDLPSVQPPVSVERFWQLAELDGGRHQGSEDGQWPSSPPVGPGALPTRGSPSRTEDLASRTEGSVVRTNVGQRHGVDLSNVLIDRSVTASATARRLHARGMSSGSTVVIPPNLGSLDTGPGMALLAHELTHVAQQFRADSALPPEHTPAGRTLETEALSAEAAVTTLPLRGSKRQPMVPSDAQLSTVAAARRVSEIPLGFPLRRDWLATESQLHSHHALPSDPQFALSGAGAMMLPKGLDPGTTPSVTPPPTAAALPVQRAEEPPAKANDSAAAPPLGASPFSERPSDADLSKMSGWLYPLISFRIRRELREDRERAGLLTNSYGRW